MKKYFVRIVVDHGNYVSISQFAISAINKATAERIIHTRNSGKKYTFEISTDPFDPIGVLSGDRLLNVPPVANRVRPFWIKISLNGKVKIFTWMGKSTKTVQSRVRRAYRNFKGVFRLIAVQDEPFKTDPFIPSSNDGVDGLIDELVNELVKESVSKMEFDMEAELNSFMFV